MRFGRRDLIAIGALLLLCLLIFWSLLTPDLSQRLWIVRGDFTSQFYPYHYFAASEWWAGRIPLWNPYMFGGHPFQADIQTAVFYPLGLVVDLIAGRHGLPFQALEWQGIVDYLLAAIFTYLFLRQVVRDRLAAFLGAAAFAFGGYLTSYPFQQFAMLETSVWLPLVLLFVEVGVQRREWTIFWWLGAGLAMAIAILAGHPQAALFTSYIAVAYALFRAWAAKLPLRRSIVGLAVLGIAAVGLSAVQLLPTLEFTAISTRAHLPYDIAASGYDYAALPGLFMPSWRNEKALYLGVVPLVLTVLAVWRGPRRYVWFWAVAALIALALSLGDRGFLYRLFYTVAPGFASFKGQERTAFVFSFAGAVLAAYGLAALRRGALRIPGRAIILIGLCLAAAAAIGIRFFWGANDVVSGDLDFARAGYPVFLLLLVAAAVLVWLTTRPKVPAGWHRHLSMYASVLLVVLSVADVAAANWHNNLSPVEPRTTPAQLSAVGFLKAQEQLEGELLRVRPQNEAALPANYGGIAGLSFASGGSPIVAQRTQDLFGSSFEWRIWQLLNVKYVVSLPQYSEALEEVFTTDPLKVYRNRFSLPRAWVVTDVQVVADPATAKNTVFADRFNPGGSAVVEQPLSLAVSPPAPGEPPLDQHLSFDYYSPSRLSLHAATNHAGLLLLSEAYYPGWQAKLDGVVVPVLHADYVLRGIALPAGEHTVEMVYKPMSFRIGLATSVATVVVSLLLIVFFLARSRMRRLRPPRNGAGR